MQNTQQILFLVGATATGKTMVSIELANKFPIEIINADSLQVFRELDIGTAKPSKEIQAQVTHHLIDILDPDASFTSKEFKVLADEKIKDIQSRNKIPLFVGGAGFYLKALANPTADLPAGTRKITDSGKAYRELQSKDPQAAKKIHPNDHYRISRALFLLDQDILPSRAFEKAASEALEQEITWLGISCDRSVLHERIERRVLNMFTDGIVNETESVLRNYPKARGRLEKTIGYGECLDVLDGRITKNDAIELTTIHTRQYAKRQDTWFRKNPSIIWSNLDHAIQHFSNVIESHQNGV
jgi:tRNA dimethylallyltransferase